MARLDIAEKRLPQDGRNYIASVAVQSTLRVSRCQPITASVLCCVCSINRARIWIWLSLVWSRQYLKLLVSLISKPHGILLVTGPTGSGKTTTLYAGLTHAHDKKRNILTVEDPIEYDLVGYRSDAGEFENPDDIRERSARHFASGSGCVMIGEIRDLETAQIAIQSSLTGHLVLSTCTPTARLVRSHDSMIWASNPFCWHPVCRVRSHNV